MVGVAVSVGPLGFIKLLSTRVLFLTKDAYGDFGEPFSHKRLTKYVISDGIRK